MTFSKQFLSFIVCSIILMPFFLHANTLDDNDMKLVFEAKYKYWQDEVKRLKTFLADDSGVTLSSFKEITNLGLPVLPCLIEKMKEDPVMYYAVLLITERLFIPKKDGNIRYAYPRRDFFLNRMFQ